MGLLYIYRMALASVGSLQKSEPQFVNYVNCYVSSDCVHWRRLSQVYGHVLQKT